MLRLLKGWEGKTEVIGFMGFLQSGEVGAHLWMGCHHQGEGIRPPEVEVGTCLKDCWLWHRPAFPGWQKVNVKALDASRCLQKKLDASQPCQRSVELSWASEFLMTGQVKLLLPGSLLKLVVPYTVIRNHFIEMTGIVLLRKLPHPVVEG